MTDKQATDERGFSESPGKSVPDASHSRSLMPPRFKAAKQSTAKAAYELRNPEKLASLKNLLLKKADDEREAILDSARREVASWLEEHTAELERMVEQIHSEAVKRAEEIAKRQIAGAEATRAKERLRLQNRLLDEACGMLQRELTALRDRPDYPDILTGLAVSAAAELPEGSSVRLSLAGEDAHLGSTLKERVAARRPEMTFEFSPDPAPITGGVMLEAPDGSWRAAADWHEVAAELKETLAERLLAAL